ncbi:siroheme synthase domain-containing protein [Flavobacterium enshiense DK69]|uniref:Probable membrane transporter protein n=1 Tax=Flavobacterium enshiense DK69 TaxID=1107311 RepID=V6SG20_9FLAO|nr:TSUP family transporter [Flavobacterium enshiense]ESU25187.1 siroheme synthase domain-containing protein [Flavobacterium enshiense DK69]KGO96918.1 siroheme synthase [Flavobacterium enshiense DK69]
MSSTLFPVFLKTETARFLIVGGGNVGLEKTETLLRQNPDINIKLVASEISSALKEVLAKHPHIDFHERPFQEADLNETDFVITATNDTLVNIEIKRQANGRKILVNAADQLDLCDFYLGSIVKKGNLKIAISTNGKSPVLARRLREHLEEAIPDDINESIENLNQFREKHKADFQAKLASLNEVTSLLVTNENPKKQGKKYKKLTFEIAVVFLALFFGYGLSTVISVQDLNAFASDIPPAFFAMIAVGFFAQMVDGAVGLGYGVTCATSMMLFGVKLPAISGSIHTAEMFSSGISGFSHYKFGNVNKKLLLWLAVPGVIGAVSGALLLIYLGNKYETVTYAILASYTMIIGIRLIIIAFRKKIAKQKVKNTGILGFSGGLLDAFGGGGWGPIVTSTLLSKGRKSSYVVGTVSLAEFFVTLAASLTFFASIGVSHWYIVVGLILGGSLAAPLAARVAGKLPQKTAILAVAFLVIVFSIRMLFKIV